MTHWFGFDLKSGEEFSGAVALTANERDVNGVVVSTIINTKEAARDIIGQCRVHNGARKVSGGGKCTWRRLQASRRRRHNTITALYITQPLFLDSSRFGHGEEEFRREGGGGGSGGGEDSKTTKSVVCAQDRHTTFVDRPRTRLINLNLLRTI